MATFEGTYEETFHSPLSPDEVQAHLSNLDALMAALPEAEAQTPLDDERLHIVMPEQKQGKHTMKPDYVVRYRKQGGDVVWSTEKGNMTTEGRASCRPSGGGTEVAYQHRIKLDVPAIPRLVAPALRPVVSKLISSNIRGFLGNLKKGLG